MAIAEDFQSIYSKQWEIYFSQCDPNGKMKLTEMANLFQLTASEHAMKGGLGFFDLKEYNQSWVMNRLRIEIDDLPVWSDFIEVKTWIEVLKGAKSIRDFEPQPDPLAQAKTQAEIEYLQANTVKDITAGDKNKADEILKIAKAQEAGAKGRKINSEADLDDLNYLEQSSGLNQDRELEKIQVQERMKALNKRPGGKT